MSVCVLEFYGFHIIFYNLRLNLTMTGIKTTVVVTSPKTAHTRLKFSLWFKMSTQKLISSFVCFVAHDWQYFLKIPSMLQNLRETKIISHFYTPSFFFYAMTLSCIYFTCPAVSECVTGWFCWSIQVRTWRLGTERGSTAVLQHVSSFLKGLFPNGNDR